MKKVFALIIISLPLIGCSTYVGTPASTTTTYATPTPTMSSTTYGTSYGAPASQTTVTSTRY